MSLRRVRQVGLACAGLGALLMLLGGGGSNPELHCEAAVAHLVECCPNFDPRLLACKQVPGCEGRHSADPDFDPDESDCLRNLDCRTLLARGLCDAVQKLPHNRWGSCAYDPSAPPDACVGDAGWFETHNPRVCYP